ncbi:helix-turn-helix transcriptional regulator [Barnesiella intestinihominis]|uniref:helix-turn-helix transcriptional regulator n=1 Tax=Barnesiella intestinihominis TaxID=487174 RepID=UPI0032C0A7EE
MNSILSYIFLIILFLSGCKEQEKNATTVQTPATHTDSYALIKSWGEYVRKGEYEILIDTAKTYYRKAIANHDKKTQAYVGAYIGQAYILSGQADSMFTYFNAAIPYVEEYHDTYIQTIIANGLGINARNTTLNYNASLAYFQEALQYADASEDKTNYYIILSNMTRIYYLRNDPSGIKYALEVYEGGSKLHNDYVRFLGALNVATMYYLSKNYDEALHYISEATAIATHMANTDEPDVIHGNILAAIGKPQQAELYFRKVLNHTQRTNIDVLTEAYLYYGNFLKAERRYDEANTAYQNGLILAEQQNHYYYRLQFYKGMAELFQEKGDIAMASQHKERHQSLADSIFNIEQERSFSHMILNYETEKAEKELSRKELLLSEKNRKLQLAVFVTGLIAVILIALYVLYVRKNHMYRQLVILYDTHRQRERQLLEQRDEKTDLVNTSQKNKALFDAVEKLMNDEHLYRSNSISIDMLVERLHSNRTYLSRMFTEQNTSFSEYINSYRIREALALLSEPENDIPLKVLSDSLGYNSLSSFYRAFQKEMGVPPSRFRQEIKKLHLDS